MTVSTIGSDRTRIGPFTVPPGWRCARRGGLVVATRPGSPAARLEWRAGPAPAYDDLMVEDDDVYDLDGHLVAYRRFGHRAGTVELISEEWCWQVRGERRALTGTVARSDYLTCCDLFDDVAATVVPDIPEP